MKNPSVTTRALGHPSTTLQALLATLIAFPWGARAADEHDVPSAAAEAPSDDSKPVHRDASSLTGMLSDGYFSGNLRAIYFSTHNAYFSGTNQDTISYGGKLGFTSARYNGFSFGASGFIQRGIDHSENPAKVDSYLGPNLLAFGEAYAKWEHDQFDITVGNQQLDVPFASTYDWRMAPQLFQGIAARYGDKDNYATAFKMLRFKSYVDNSFKKLTTYNSNVDSFSGIGREETNGFWGLGGARKLTQESVVLNGQAWYMNYQDYANLFYTEGQVIAKGGDIKPFLGLQYFNEHGSGRQLLGKVESQVYGLQLGLKRNSLTASLSYDRITPHGDSYLNGSLVTPYAHNVASGPIFAQPFLSSTQDLGAGNAYALDLNGSPANNWFVGARYSFMGLRSSAASASSNTSELMAFAIYNFGGKLKGLSIANFLAVEQSPLQKNKFYQNRLELEYAWGG